MTHAVQSQLRAWRKFKSVRFRRHSPFTTSLLLECLCLLGGNHASIMKVLSVALAVGVAVLVSAKGDQALCTACDVRNVR